MFSSASECSARADEEGVCSVCSVSREGGNTGGVVLRAGVTGVFCRRSRILPGTAARSFLGAMSTSFTVSSRDSETVQPRMLQPCMHTKRLLAGRRVHSPPQMRCIHITTLKQAIRSGYVIVVGPGLSLCVCSRPARELGWRPLTSRQQGEAICVCDTVLIAAQGLLAIECFRRTFLADEKRRHHLPYGCVPGVVIIGDTVPA
jgi:hypothetical protein